MVKQIENEYGSMELLLGRAKEISVALKERETNFPNIKPDTIRFEENGIGTEKDLN